MICGEVKKDLSEEELKMKLVAQGSLVAKDDIKSGQMIFKDTLTEKRPGTGISPMDVDKVIGKHAIRDIRKDEVIQYGYLSK